MAATSMKALALVEIFLLLSVNPITAYRAHEVETLVTGVEGAHRLVKEELERALQEDALGSDFSQAVNETHGYFGESFASCPQRREDFERRAGKVKARYDEAKADGKIDAAEAVWVILKVRVLAKTLSAAEGKGCEWATQGSAEAVDKSALEALLAELAPKQPCVGAAKKTLEAARGADGAGQKAAVLQGLGMLLSQGDACKPAEVGEPSEDEVAARLREEGASGAEEEDEAIEAAYAAGQYEKEMRKTEAMMLEVHRTGSLHGREGEWLQTGELVSARGDLGDFAWLVTGVVFFIVLTVVWFLFCWVVPGILLMVLGLIFCLLNSIFASFIKLFGGSSAWDSDYLNCASWWLGAVSKTIDNGMGLTVCTVETMNRLVG